MISFPIRFRNRLSSREMLSDSVTEIAGYPRRSVHHSARRGQVGGRLIIAIDNDIRDKSQGEWHGGHNFCFRNSERRCPSISWIIASAVRLAT